MEQTSSDLLYDPLWAFQASAEIGCDSNNDVVTKGVIESRSNDDGNVTGARQQPQQPMNQSSLVEPSKNITVEVSGSRFCIVPTLFKNIENLHWKRNNGILKLHTDPDVFEMILQYFLFASLPDCNNLSSRNAKELIELIAPLDQLAVQPLTKHLETFLASKKSKETSSSSFLKRSISINFSSFSSRMGFPTRHRANSGNTVVTKNDSSTQLPINDSKQDDMANIMDVNTDSSTIPSQIDMMKKTHHPPPIPHVSVTNVRHKSTSPSAPDEGLAPTRTDFSNFRSLAISDSSSSDGSISKLSQSSFAGGMPAQDENYEPTISYDPQQPHQEQKRYREAKEGNDNTNEFRHSCCAYPKAITTGLDSAASSFLVEKDFNIQTQLQSIMPNITLINDAKDVYDGDDDKHENSKRNIAIHPKRSVKLLRDVLGGVGGGNHQGNQKKMTHADWCMSEYVL